MGIFAWSTLWVYLLAQIIGGIAAGVAFVYVCTQGISAASVVPWWSWLAR
jgi:glycerol uptake facilitator-like aquaporin